MTTDNGTTAVAEAEVTAPETLEVTPESEAVVTDASVAAPEAESTPDASVEDESFDFDKVHAEVTGADASVPDTIKADLPGKTEAQIAQERYNQDVAAVNSLLREEQAPFVKAMQEQFGISGEVAQALWVEHQRPLLQRAVSLREELANERVKEAVASMLTPEEYDTLWAENRQYNGRREFAAAAKATIEARKEAEWQEKVKKGDYLTKAHAKEITDIALERNEARLVRMFKEGTYQSGQDASGKASNTTGPKDLQEAELMHAGLHPSGRTFTNDQMRAYLASQRKG